MFCFFNNRDIILFYKSRVSAFPVPGSQKNKRIDEKQRNL